LCDKALEDASKKIEEWDMASAYQLLVNLPNEYQKDAEDLHLSY
jgi:hypothetical protein